MRKLLLMLTLLLGGGMAQADHEIIKGVRVDAAGIIRVGNVGFRLNHYDGQWNFTNLSSRNFSAAKGFFSASAAGAVVKGQWRLGSAAPSIFEVVETLQRLDDSTLRYTAELRSGIAIPTRALCLALELPLEVYADKRLFVDGGDVLLPSEYGQTTLLRKAGVRSLIVPVGPKRLVLAGNLDVHIQDNRKFNRETVVVRILFEPGQGEITESRLDMTLGFRGYDSEPVSIRKQANRGFEDGAADDGIGGWSDQGPENDLRMLSPGRREIGGVTFDIVDPRSNAGNSCLVFTCQARKSNLESAELIPETKLNRHLYLLHALAWAPKKGVEIGQVLVEYTDGDVQRLGVECEREVGDWWGPHSLENGVVAWTGENADSYVGLFLSKFALEGKAIKSIRLNPEQNAVWMVVGLSLSDQDIPVENYVPPHTIVAGGQWAPLTSAGTAIEAGSLLDFSFLQDAPAGKHGRVVVRDGHFEFENRRGRPVRFYGNNLCFSAQYLDKAACQTLADQFVRIGYNSVRFHHYDNELVDPNAADSTTLDAQMLDRLDYLFHCFKQRGIYVTTDLYCSRRFKPGEVEGYGRLSHYEMKALAPIDEAAFENWKTFSRRLLTHRNPYTGLTWGEDPALFAISVINEDTIYREWDKYPAIQAAYLRKFEEHLTQKNLTCRDEAERARRFSRFLTDLQINMFSRMKEFLTRELKVKALLSDANHRNSVVQSFIREKLDYVDNHAYWDHPHFVDKKWRLPHRYTNASVIRKLAAVPRTIMPARILGKPYMVTEFNCSYPNEYRAEIGPVMGAYAALQDWDGLYRFAYSHSSRSILEPVPINGFDLVADPLHMLSEKIAILFFLRGDVDASDEVVPLAYHEDCFDQVKGMEESLGVGFPDEYSKLGLRARIGAVHADRAGRWAKGPNEAVSGSRIGSSTGQICIDGDRMEFAVVTPRSEAVVLDGAKRLAGKVMSVENQSGFGVVCAAAMDDEPLESSRRILLLHLTDVQNNKAKYQTAQKKILLDWGSLPLLVRKGEAMVTLRRETNSTVQAWALSMGGARLKRTPVRRTADGIAIRCDTAETGGVMAYEILFE